MTMTPNAEIGRVMAELRQHLEAAVGLAADIAQPTVIDRLLDLLDELSFLEAIARAEAT
jgi:hypothetical protein